MENTIDINAERGSNIRRGSLLAYLTIIWNSLERIIAVSAGIFAGSIALVGFGVDSVIEVSSGAIILWRLASDEARERLALKLVGFNFLTLAAYVRFVAVKSLTHQEPPNPNLRMRSSFTINVRKALAMISSRRSLRQSAASPTTMSVQLLSVPRTIMSHPQTVVSII